MKVGDVDLDHMRKSLIKRSVARCKNGVTDADIEFLAEDTRTDAEYVKNVLKELGVL